MLKSAYMKSHAATSFKNFLHLAIHKNTVCSLPERELAGLKKLNFNPAN